jgi:SAM-dependent methyltransferase
VKPVDAHRRTSFDAMAERYDAARPGYPDALFRDVLARTGARHVLEIGAGTGQATLGLARLGCDVLALEPGPRLAAILRAKVAGFAGVRVVESTFEEWSRSPTRCDLVLAAQSLHWVDPVVRYAGAARVAPYLAVVVNATGPIDPAIRAEIDRAYERWTGGDGNVRARHEVEIARREWAAEIAASGLYGPAHVVERPWDDVHTAASYVRRISTYSDHATLPDAVRAGLYADIAAAIDRQGGRLVVPTVALACVARVL